MNEIFTADDLVEFTGELFRVRYADEFSVTLENLASGATVVVTDPEAVQFA